MTEIKKALYFSFPSQKILQSHLFEHCLGAYFLDHQPPYYRASTHPLGVYLLFEKGEPILPTVSELEPYIDNQKKRLNLELLEDLDARAALIERMHNYCTESWEDTLRKIEGVLGYRSPELLQDFGEFVKTKVEIANLSTKLPAVPQEGEFMPLKHQLKIPKLNRLLDVAEVAVRLPQSLENMAYLANVYVQIRERLKKLIVLEDVVYKHRVNVLTLGSGYQYFTLSLKTRASEGERALSSFLKLFRDFVLDESDFEGWKKGMVEKYHRLWQDGKLTDLLVTELVLWRRILQPEDFANLSYKSVMKACGAVNSPASLFLLTDF